MEEEMMMEPQLYDFHGREGVSEPAGNWFHQKSISRIAELFVKPPGCTEIRAFLKSGGIITGYFNIPEKFVEAAKYLSSFAGEIEGIYFMPNPIKEEFLSLYLANELVGSWQAAKAGIQVKVVKDLKTTSDGDIIFERTLIFDIDTKTPISKISASDSEIRKTREVAMKLKEYLNSKDIHHLTSFSGNGYHLIIFLAEYEFTPEHIREREAIFRFASESFSDENSEIDRKVSNPARLIKIPGTPACKGSNDIENDRLWRRSMLLDYKPPKQVDLYEKFRAEVQTYLETTTTPQIAKDFSPDSASGSFDLLAFLDALGISYRKSKNKDWLYELEECPACAGGHDPWQARLTLTNGHPGFGCFHNRASGYGWNDFSNYATSLGVDPKNFWTRPQIINPKLVESTETEIQTIDVSGPERPPTDAPGEWEDPVENTTSLPEWSWDVIPSPLKEIGQEIAKTMGVQNELAGIATLGAASIALGNKAIVQIKPGHYQYANLYFMIVASVAGGKSPTIKEVQKPLVEWQKSRQDSYQKELQEYEARKSRINAQIRGIEKAIERKQKTIGD